MAQLSIAAAARAVGKDRGTIHRYIKSGKLSASKNTSGHTVIETAELLRVFGMLQADGGKTKKETVAHAVAAPVENSGVQHVLEATLELLKQQLKASQEREERLLAMLGQEQESRRELERRLLPPGTGLDTAGSAPHPVPEPEEESLIIEAQQEISPVTVIVPPPPTEPAPERQAKERKGFFSSLFGK